MLYLLREEHVGAENNKFMTWIKRQFLKILLRIVNKIGGRMRVAVAKRADIYARVKRTGSNHWSEPKLLKQGLRFRNYFIKK